MHKAIVQQHTSCAREVRRWGLASSIVEKKESEVLPIVIASGLLALPLHHVIVHNIAFAMALGHCTLPLQIAISHCQFTSPTDITSSLHIAKFVRHAIPWG